MIGAQVLAPHDAGIIDEVNNIASAADYQVQGEPGSDSDHR